jgi:hypothetical protein
MLGEHPNFHHLAAAVVDVGEGEEGEDEKHGKENEQDPHVAAAHVETESIV